VPEKALLPKETILLLYYWITREEKYPYIATYPIVPRKPVESVTTMTL
jgi:hypothetical protein